MKKADLKKLRAEVEDVATGKVAPARAWKVEVRTDGTVERKLVDPETYRQERAAEAEAESVALTARRKLGVSQDHFAALLGISANTLRKWEQKQRKPSGAAELLLRVAARNPEVVLAAAQG